MTDAATGPDAAAPEDAQVREAVLREVARHAVDRPEAREALAAAALRRVSAAWLRNADASGLADRLHELFDLADRRPAGRVEVRAGRPKRGLDAGRVGTVVQVAAEDRPFLLSTVSEELAARGLTVTARLHPIVGVERDARGRLATVGPARPATDREAVLHLELAEALDEEEATDLVERLRGLLADVVAVTEHHAALRQRLREAAEAVRSTPTAPPDACVEEPPASAADVDPEEDPEEVAELVDWLLEDRMVLLGVREYVVVEADGERALQVVHGRGLGLLADDGHSAFVEPVPLRRLPPRLRERLEGRQLLAVSRTRRPSPVQRQEPMQDVRLLLRGADGRVERAVRLLGLFTRKGLAEPASSAPVLRGKLRCVLEREDVVPGSHDETRLVALFESLPKDELLRSSTSALHGALLGLLHAEEHQDVRVIVRADPDAGVVAVLVTAPRDAWSPGLRRRVEELCRQRFDARRVETHVALGDRPVAVGRFLLHVDGEPPDVPVGELEAAVRRAALPWLEDLGARLGERVGPTEAERLRRDLGARLPASYRHAAVPEEAVDDVLLLDAHRRAGRDLHVEVTPPAAEDDLLRVRAVKRGGPLVLSAFVPVLESLGLEVVEEVPHRLEGVEVTLHDVRARAPGAATEELSGRGGLLADAVHAMWDGHLLVDSLNRLVLRAGLPWRDVAVLRAYRRYRRQLGTVHTPEYVNDVLVAERRATVGLVEHFHARFDPDRPDAERDARRATVLEACRGIDRLDHDRIVRGLLALIDATVRTNAFRHDAVDADGAPYLALKVDPSLVPSAPRPVPHREVFVHGPRVEGVHLRAGAVARGGVRWSDRRDDVRAEVLELVKAQVRKNALIVPTGAKGGFVLRDEPDDPERLPDAVRAAYVTFVRGLLDVTDDLQGGRAVPPPRVVRHDGDDAYLVVAADRGTAALSDTANAVAARYGHWLGDAFASGGSNGYDHKALGVTARGAWTAVRRHFRELGVDVQREPIDVVGVGDMSGDVFGNGLLRSRALRLVAAFDHRHVFLDPDPDPEAAYEERRRLFELPGSSWADYDPTLISEGGGVHRRDATSVPLSPQVRRLLRVEEEELSPPALVRAVLAAPVDLLYAGGVGTYVKASDERHEEVGDPACDEVRVDADAVRARMIAEGANLFATQRGRVQYARRGGRVDQDAIHNAAGVATSDAEVNIKALLGLAVAEGRLAEEDRSGLLREVGDEVVARVLDDVDAQTAAISREAARSPEAVGTYLSLLERLDPRQEFDRAVEALPDDAELAERAAGGAGLTRPELAALLAWSKRDLKDRLLASGVPDADVLAEGVRDRFPPRLVERFGDLLDRHPVRRELAATALTNALVDGMGVAFASTLADERSVDLADVALAWEVARRCLDADRAREAIDGLEGELDPLRVVELHERLRWLLSRVTATVLSDARADESTALLGRLRRVADEVRRAAPSVGDEDRRRRLRARLRRLADDLVPDELALTLAAVRELVLVPDVAAVVAALPERSPADALDAALRAGERLGVDALEEALERVDAPVGWARRQRRGVEADLLRLRREAATAALAARPDLDPAEAVADLLRRRGEEASRCRALVDEVTAMAEPSLEAASVAARALADITRSRGWAAEPGAASGPWRP